MPRIFNTTGLCNPADHYMLPAAARLPQVMGLVEKKSYFVIHAPRQTGKTTALYELARQLTDGGRYAAALSMEVGQPYGDQPDLAEGPILEDWRHALRAQLPADLQPPPWPTAEPRARIGAALTAWAGAAPRPLALFLAEVDALQDLTLVAVLRQLRSGFARRPRHFPSSIALVGLRDIRDYKVASGGSGRLGASSPFNISAESLTLPNFSRADVAALYGQHATDTGQAFLPDAVDRAFEITDGQPWLVNALARQCVEVLVPDRTRPVTRSVMDQAKEILISRQDTHLDSLAERLREARVRRVIEPILAGRALVDVPEDDRRFVIDLGLVRRSTEGGLVIANPIYREVIPRVLTNAIQDSLPSIQPMWLKPDGRVDMCRLLDAFLAFWRRHGQPLLKSSPYHEVAPHLVMMAFLHRLANAGGTIEREYAIGSGRIDICVRCGPDAFAFELKVWRADEPDPLAEGLVQLDGYLAGLGLETGWLVIFDQRPGQPPIAERTRAEEAATPGGRRVTVVRG
ncbi:MAG: ATP-binding protein [Planctomycetes bacterium]|nr:ATP-binding protein [Planctomycetota bacterium]